MEDEKRKFADLHVHTYYSDGTFSPEEVIDCAAEKGLSCIAVCDHDCIDAIGPCIEYGRKKGVEVIPGVELSVAKDDSEIHMLGYFIDWKDRHFAKKLKDIQDARTGRIRKMIEKLEGLGIHVDAEKVFERAGKGSVGRLHLAEEMVASGAVKNLEQAFRKYIGDLQSCYVANINLTPPQAVELILSVGGVPVLGHPHIMGKDSYIEEFVKYGLRGIEAYHTDHGPEAAKKYGKIARKLGLLITGGSDCHGLGKGRVLMGGVKIPYEFVEKLREESRRIRKARNIADDKQG